MNRWLVSLLTGIMVLSVAAVAVAGDVIGIEARTNSGFEAAVVGEAQLTRSPGVSVLFAPSDADQPSMRTAVSAMGSIDAFDYIDASYYTPTVGEMSAYDVVITFPNYSYQDCYAMGDNLADYVDGGGRVILMVWCTYTMGNPLCGRIMSDGYSPYYAPTGGNWYYWSETSVFDPGCCITTGLEWVGQYFRDMLAEYPGTTTCAYYMDGEHLAGFNAMNTVHYLNGFTGEGFSPGYWDGDWYMMIWNSIMGLTLMPTATEDATWGGVKALYN